jgi:chemotaxis protein MotB
MASYMDMVTVLMCTFIVLFAMSSINAKKFDELKNSLQTGFGVVKSQKVDTAKGIVVPPADVNKKNVTTPTPLDLAKIEVTNLQKLEAEINASLTAQGLQSSVSYTIDARGLTIGLVGDQTFFDSNLAALTPVATQIVNTIGPILGPTSYNLSIEGHADARPPGPPYDNNWQLASARALSVLQELSQQAGIAATRLDAVSYGSAQAAAQGSTPSDMAEERRVDVVVLDGQTEQVRDLIPKVLSEEEGASVSATTSEAGGQ